MHYDCKWHNRRYLRKKVDTRNNSVDSWMNLCLVQSSLMTRQKWCYTPDAISPADTSPSRIVAPHLKRSSTVFRSFAIPPASCNSFNTSRFLAPLSKLDSCRTSGCLDYQLTRISTYRGIPPALRSVQTRHGTIVRIKEPMSLNTQNSARQACQCMGQIFLVNLSTCSSVYEIFMQDRMSDSYPVLSFILR